jgi:hypothetical protein
VRVGFGHGRGHGCRFGMGAGGVLRVGFLHVSGMVMVLA